MLNYIVLILFAGIITFIVMLYVRRRRIELGMANFYKDHALFTTTNSPPVVRAALAASDNLFCCSTNLNLNSGSNIKFYWWEWYLTSNTMINGVQNTSFTNYLAFSFEPNSVSDGSIKNVIDSVSKNNANWVTKIRRMLGLNNALPYRSEKLADGTFLICWQVMKQREVLEEKIEWIKNNAEQPAAPSMEIPLDNLAINLNEVVFLQMIAM